MSIRSAIPAVLALLLFAGLAGAQPRQPSPAECQALRDRVGEHARVSLAARRALGITTPSAPSAAPDPITRAEAIRTRLAEIREEQQRLEDEKVGALIRLEFARVARLQEQLEALDRERRALEAELAGIEQGRPAKRPGIVRPATPAGPNLARVSCQELPALEEKALKARRKELGGAEGQAGLVPLVPIRGQTEREVGQELAAQLGSGLDARERLGLLDQDGDTQVDGFSDSPAAGIYRLYRQREDGSVAVDLFVAGSASPDAPYGEAARRIEEALLRQTRRRLAELLSLRPVGPVRLLGETGDFTRVRALADAGRFDQVIQAASLGARSVEFQNYRGEAVRLLEAVTGGGGIVQFRTASIVVRAGGEEHREEIVTRFRPLSSWRTEVEVEMSREIRSMTGSVIQPHASVPTIRFALER